MPTVVDHLVVAVPELAEGVRWFAELSGVEATPGGAHEGRGTHNALLSLGDSYLELIAADPSQPEPESPRAFGVDDVTEPTLVTFAVRAASGDMSIDSIVATARASGWDPGDAVSMSRLQQDQTRLHWSLTTPLYGFDGAVPFIIDWGTTPHPSRSTPAGVSLEDFMVTHPKAAEVSSAYNALGLAVAVFERSTVRLTAQLKTPKGDITIR
ncbi:MAG: VOC family protein [Acidimicrobiales bacterium]